MTLRVYVTWKFISPQNWLTFILLSFWYSRKMPCRQILFMGNWIFYENRWMSWTKIYLNKIIIHVGIYRPVYYLLSINCMLSKKKKKTHNIITFYFFQNYRYFDYWSKVPFSTPSTLIIQVLIAAHTPPYELRHNQMESVFLSAIDMYGPKFNPENIQVNEIEKIPISIYYLIYEK